MERELTVQQLHPELALMRDRHPDLEDVHPKFLVPLEAEDTYEDFELEPPKENEPTYRALARVGIENFTEQDKVPTPLTPEGLVDVPALIELVKSIVGERAWEAPFFDIHHLYWPCADYENDVDEDEFLDGEGMGYSDDDREVIAVRKRFRELEQNKIGVPRIFHDVVHAITLPPTMPSLEIMKREIRKERCNQHLYRVANKAVSIQESLGRMKPIYNQKGSFRGYHDSKEKRTYDSESKLRQMERRKKAFITQIFKAYKNGIIDLSDIAPLEYVDRKVLEDNIKDVVGILDDGMTVIHRKRVLKVDLEILHIAKASYRKGVDLAKAA